MTVVGTFETCRPAVTVPLSAENRSHRRRAKPTRLTRNGHPASKSNAEQVQTALDTNPGLKGVKINADTLGSKDSVALRGKVKTASQKTLAEALAKQNAPGYKIIDQLTVVK